MLVGSQTGTAEGLAKRLAKEADVNGFSVKVLPLDKYESMELTKEERLLLITSTYGDGEPPDNAVAFWSYLNGTTAPLLQNLQYSVLALGDSNYSAFCEFGKQCDARLEALGAKRIHPRVDCDVDYDHPARLWSEAVFNALKNGHGSEVAAPPSVLSESTVEVSAPRYSRQYPYLAELLVNRKLTRVGSSKDVRHFEIAIPDPVVTYEVGDALGVHPTNCSDAVSELMGALQCDGEEAVEVAGIETSLRIALTQHFEIAKPSGELLTLLADAGHEILRDLLASNQTENLQNWLWGRQVIDLLSSAGTLPPVDKIIKSLKKLHPRLYSISSSPKMHPGEVHLTVCAVRYESLGRQRRGVCSTFLADRCGERPNLPVFVQPSHGFRLPKDGDAPIIMCGPGTGIAPFRAFLEERQITGARGRNWLLFGDQKRATDYLYEEVVEEWRRGGHISRLDLAFSRDQEEKVYVQHRMLEAADVLWSWLQDGAHFYVCGDAGRMAKDVDATLQEVAIKAGGLNADEAAEYFAEMKTAKRYQRDVY